MSHHTPRPVRQTDSSGSFAEPGRPAVDHHYHHAATIPEHTNLFRVYGAPEANERISSDHRTSFPANQHHHPSTDPSNLRSAPPDQMHRDGSKKSALRPSLSPQALCSCAYTGISSTKRDHSLRYENVYF